VTAGFIHESVNTSISFADHSTQLLSLLVTKLHPSAPIVLGLPWLQGTNPTIDWSALSLTFNTGPQSALPSLALARACSTAALRHEDIISISLLLLILFLNFVLHQDFDPNQGSPDRENDVFCQVWGHSRQTLRPLLDLYLGTDPDSSHLKLMHSWDPLSPWFSASDKVSPTAGGVSTPATIFPLLREDHVNNHLSLGVPPRTRIREPRVKSRSFLANQKV